MRKLSDKKITIHFKAKDSSEHLKITYQLYDHQLTERWWALLEKSSFDKGIIGATSFNGQILDDVDFLVTTLNYLILKINTFVKKNSYADLTISQTVEKNVSQKTLNELHYYFEKNSIDERLAEPLKNTFKLLNLFIHRMENFSDGKINNCVFIEVTPVEWLFLPFEESDYKLFTPDWTWGEINLNYGLVGIPTLQAFLNSALPRPQNCFSAGVYLSFVEDSKFDRYEELNQWLSQTGLPPNDPRCAIGYIPLGKMITPEIPSTEDERTLFLMQFKKFTQIEKVEFIGKTSNLNINPTRYTPEGFFNI